MAEKSCLRWYLVWTGPACTYMIYLSKNACSSLSGCYLPALLRLRLGYSDSSRCSLQASLTVHPPGAQQGSLQVRLLSNVSGCRSLLVPPPRAFASVQSRAVLGLIQLLAAVGSVLLLFSVPRCSCVLVLPCQATWLTRAEGWFPAAWTQRVHAAKDCSSARVRERLGCPAHLIMCWFV